VARNIRWFALGAAVVVVALMIGLPLALTSSADFFSRYHSLSQNYDNLQTSSHKGLRCADCHVDRRGPIAHELGLVGDFYASLVPNQKAPVFTKFDKPANEACLGCHLTEWSDEASRTVKVPHPAHLRVANETRECVKCHKWTAHEETYAQKHKSMPFSGVCVAYGCHVGTKKTDQCGNCHHLLNETAQQWTTEHPRIVQASGGNGCLETCHDISQCRLCHTTGRRPVFSGPGAETGMKAIEALHVKSTWLQLHGTEALKDQSKCMKCHVTDGECRACHSQRPAFHGSTATWIGTHKALAKDQRRCLACHKKPWCDDCHKQFKEMR
jgi:hypothetical protein